MTDLPDKLRALADDFEAYAEAYAEPFFAGKSTIRLLREAEAALRDNESRSPTMTVRGVASLVPEDLAPDEKAEMSENSCDGKPHLTHEPITFDSEAQDHICPACCLVAERDYFKAELAEARRDTERLDWLSNADQMDFAMPVADPVTKRWYIYHNDDGSDVCNKDTLREAIDAAMKKTDDV